MVRRLCLHLEVVGLPRGDLAKRVARRVDTALYERSDVYASLRDDGSFARMHVRLTPASDGFHACTQARDAPLLRVSTHAVW